MIEDIETSLCQQAPQVIFSKIRLSTAQSNMQDNTPLPKSHSPNEYAHKQLQAFL